MKRKAVLLILLSTIVVMAGISVCSAATSLDLSDPGVRQRLDVKRGGADTELLAKISLPKHPTTKQVRQYIASILLISRNQQIYGATDPQVAMLMEVGHKHLAELIDTPGNDVTQIYISAAIKALVRKGDKAKIIKSLDEHPKLVAVLMAKGWTQDARKKLISRLRENPNNLPYDWIAAVASLKDRSTYGPLLNYLMNGSNKRLTYKYISGLPGIDLRQAVPVAWEKSRNDKYEMADLTEGALAVGYLPALDYVVASLDSAPVPGVQYSPRALLFQFTAVQGTNEELRKWYEENRKKLIFDAQLKRFVVSTARASGLHSVE